MSEKIFIKRETIQGIANATKEKTGLTEIAVTDIEDHIRGITGGDDGSTDLANEAIVTEAERLDTRLNGDSTESGGMYNAIYFEGYDHGHSEGYEEGANSTAEIAKTEIDAQTARLQARTGGDDSESKTMVENGVASKIEEMNKSLEDLTKQVDETLLALDDIKKSIEDSGIEVGNAPLTEYADKVGALYEAGEKAEYDKFWDACQNYGNPSDMFAVFAGRCWTDTTFFPKYDIIFTSGRGDSAFAYTNISELKSILERANVILDTSKTTNMSQAFQYSYVRECPTLNLINCTGIYNLFCANAQLEYIEKIIISSKCTEARYAFERCKNLHHIIFEGEIANNHLNMSWSPLNKVSLTSIVNALSTTTSGLTVTLRLSAVNAAFETSEGANDGSTSQEWLELRATKSNWDISLIDS